MIFKEFQLGGSSGIVDMKRLVHELRTHKIELEMQNDELRRAELRLRQSARRYADLYDFAPVGYVTLSKHHVIREINLKGATLLQKDRILLIGDLFDKYIDEGYVEVFKQHVAQLLKSNQKQACNIRLQDVGGEPFYAHLESITWPDEDSGDFSIRIVLSDISSQVRTEAELIQAKEKAEQANLAKSQFLANMSHEIRTPLAAIMGYSEIVLTELERDSDLEKSVSGIKRNGEHLLQLIDDILDISRVEAGEMVIDWAACDPLQEIKNTLESLRQQAEAKALLLTLETLGEIPKTIMTDATRLRQIVMNLVNNAIKFTASGKVKVEISQDLADEEAQQLIIDVIDSGCGISPESQSSLFKPFSQVDPSHSRKFGGIGLGLYLSRRLAQGLGGDVKLIASSVGQGSTFRVQVKLRTLPDDIVLAVPASQPKVDHHVLEGLTILLVEDSPNNQVVLRSMIEMAGATVLCAEDGVHAVSMAMEKTVDLVLMDLQLPLLDGYKATAELRRQRFQKPILALTAHAFHAEQEKVLKNEDFDGFLTKPIGLKKLVDVLKKWTGRNHPRPASQDRELNSSFRQPLLSSLGWMPASGSERSEGPDL